MGKLRYPLHPPAQVCIALAAAKCAELTAFLAQPIFIPRYGAGRHDWFVRVLGAKRAAIPRR